MSGRLYFSFGFCRATFASDRWKASVEPNFEKETLSEHLLSGNIRAEGDTLVEQILEMPDQSLQEQVDVLSSVPNFHWWDFVNLQGKVKASTTAPKAGQKLLFNPEHNAPPPTSPRNILMHYLPLLSGGDLPLSLEDLPVGEIAGEMRFMENLMRLIKYDQGILESVVSNKKSKQTPSTHSTPANEVDPVPEPPPKKRRYTTRVISANIESLDEDLIFAGPAGPKLVTSSVPDRSMFTLFCEELISDGLIQWRHQSEEENVVLMNDFDCETGQMQPLDFVHVTRLASADDEVHLKCTCQTYKNMHGKALQRETMDVGETVLDINFTCMHCRFYKKYLLPLESSLHSQDSLSNVHQMVQQTMEELNSPITLLGSASPNRTTKFSVFGEEFGYAILHVHFSSNVCFCRCMSGLCASKYKIRKRVPKGISLRDLKSGEMCTHLRTLLFNTDILEEVFPEFFKNTDPTPDHEAPSADILDPDVINMDDIDIRDFDPGIISFNTSEGKWECSSYSTHTPKMHRMDTELSDSTRARARHCGGELNKDGFYKGPDLFSSASCCEVCGEVFSEDSDAEFRTVTVYARYVSTFVLFKILSSTDMYIRPISRLFVLAVIFRCSAFRPLS